METLSKSSIFFTLSLFLYSLHSTEALYGPKSDVVVVSTPSEFKSKVVDTDDVVLVEFFAPWCGHCKSLAPQWEKAASALKGIAAVVAVDCDSNPSLAQEYGVKGFPTIKVFAANKKKPADYQGARDAKGIVDFALGQVKGLVHQRLSGKASSSKSKGSKGDGPSAVVELTDNSFYKEVLHSSDIWMVEFYAPWCGHCKNLAPEWKKAANSMKGQVKFGAVDCTTQKLLAEKYDIKGFPHILMFGADKESPVAYDGPRTAGALESFALTALEDNSVAPEVVELTSQEVMEGSCGKSVICFVAFLPHILDTGAEGRIKYIEILRTMAQKFKKSPYSYVWTAAGAQPQLEAAAGIGGYGYPALIALSMKKQAYAPFKSAFEEAHVRTFVQAMAQGGKDILPITAIPALESHEPWDGLDGQPPEVEEFSLDELMDEGTPAAADEL